GSPRRAGRCSPANGRPGGSSWRRSTASWGKVMPDWKRYVRERLSLPKLRPERAAEIVEDLAQQLDDACRAALKRGPPAEEAEAAAAGEIQGWDPLARDIILSERRDRLPLDQRVLERLQAG